MLEPMADEPASLLDVTGGLLSDPAAKAAFEADPQGYIERHGLDDLTPTELHDALGFVADSLPAPLAAQLESIEATDQLDGVDAIVHELGQVAELDPGTGGDLGLGDDPLDGFDQPVEPTDVVDDVDPALPDDDGPAAEEAVDPFAVDDGGSFGEGSADTTQPDLDPDLGIDDDYSVDPGDAAPIPEPEPMLDPAFDLDDSVGDAVPPVTPLDGADDEPEDTFDETDFDNSVDPGF
jgi:hypothetical protein